MNMKFVTSIHQVEFKGNELWINLFQYSVVGKKTKSNGPEADHYTNNYLWIIYF